MTDSAIIRPGCRFPGARDTRAFWKLLMSGERRASSVPAERRDRGPFHEPGDRSACHPAYLDQVAFLDGVDRFDALRCGVPPALARGVGPRCRPVPDDAETGCAGFGLDGLRFAVDAARPGSQAAFGQAVARTARGTCRIAVVGGVPLDLAPGCPVGCPRLRGLSAAGTCRPFGEGADGFVLVEGAGTVVLRPLADALAAGDRIHAVVRGIGSAGDGASPGPSRAVRRADGIEALWRPRTEWPGDDPALCHRVAGKPLIGRPRSAAGTAAHPEPGGAAAGPRQAAAGSSGSGGTGVHAAPGRRPV
ncbi:beta-ketoacyl synthase N-terminal-like domain-containing protein, partial [Streptomyces racemochromogenes]